MHVPQSWVKHPSDHFIVKVNLPTDCTKATNSKITKTIFKFLKARVSTKFSPHLSQRKIRPGLIRKSFFAAVPPFVAHSDAFCFFSHPNWN